MNVIMMEPKINLPLEFISLLLKYTGFKIENEKRSYIWWSLKIQILRYIDVPCFWLDAKDIACVSTSYCVGESVSYKTTTKHIQQNV